MVDFFTGLQPLEPGETDPGRLAERVRELDASGAIDRVLVGTSSIWPHNHATAPYRLGVANVLELAALSVGTIDVSLARQRWPPCDAGPARWRGLHRGRPPRPSNSSATTPEPTSPPSSTRPTGSSAPACPAWDSGSGSLSVLD